MKCTKCNDVNVTKNGFVRGKQRYRCKSRNHNFTANPKSKAIPESIKGLAYVLYLEGTSFRGIERILKVSRVSVMKWIRSLPETLKPHKPEGNAKTHVRIVEIDETWHYVEKKRGKRGFGSLLIEIPEKYSHGTSAVVARNP